MGNCNECKEQSHDCSKQVTPLGKYQEHLSDHERGEVLAPLARGETLEFASEELGFGAVFVFDPAKYDPLEMDEISEMVMRVVEAWHKRREFFLANLDKYGVTVN